MALLLYGREDCSLCRLAEEALHHAAVSARGVNIDADATLEARYGTRIPVLRCESNGAELDWPFDAYAIRRLQAGAA